MTAQTQAQPAPSGAWGLGAPRRSRGRAEPRRPALQRASRWPLHRARGGRSRRRRRHGRRPRRQRTTTGTNPRPRSLSLLPWPPLAASRRRRRTLRRQSRAWTSHRPACRVRDDGQSAPHADPAAHARRGCRPTAAFGRGRADELGRPAEAGQVGGLARTKRMICFGGSFAELPRSNLIPQMDQEISSAVVLGRCSSAPPPAVFDSGDGAAARRGHARGGRACRDGAATDSCRAPVRGVGIPGPANACRRACPVWRPADESCGHGSRPSDAPGHVAPGTYTT